MPATKHRFILANPGHKYLHYHFIAEGGKYADEKKKESSLSNGGMCRALGQRTRCQAGHLA